MSDDLISRKAVLDILFEARIRDTLLASPTFIEILRRRIKELPAAFDKEKVIDELKRMEEESCKEWNEYGDAASLGKVIAFAEALEIVEKGGIE